MTTHQDHLLQPVRCLIVIAILFAGLSACVWSNYPAPPPQAETASLGQSFDLRFGKEIIIQDEGLHLSFESVLTDSRCPTKVNCAWTGEAVLTIQVWKDSSPNQSLKFNTNPAPTQTIDRLAYGDYQVHLQALQPYPNYPVPIPEKSYWVTLEVTR